MELPALAFLAAVVLVKEAGVPIPVPGDLLVIGAGVAAAHGPVPAPAVVAVLVAASIGGGAIQFLLIRGRARRALLRLLARVGLPESRIETQAARLRRGGASTVAVARMTPGVRIVAVAASSLAGLAAGPFLIGLAVGNAVFLSAHFALGLVVGEPAVRLVSGATVPLVAGGLVLAIVGAAGWWLRSRVMAPRRRAERLAPSPSAGSAVQTFSDWADACCPACLTIALVAPGGATDPG